MTEGGMGSEPRGSIEPWTKNFAQGDAERSSVADGTALALSLLAKGFALSKMDEILFSNLTSFFGCVVVYV